MEIVLYTHYNGYKQEGRQSADEGVENMGPSLIKVAMLNGAALWTSQAVLLYEQASPHLDLMNENVSPKTCTLGLIVAFFIWRGREKKSLEKQNKNRWWKALNAC
jgi:hypothetical protein